MERVNAYMSLNGRRYDTVTDALAADRSHIADELTENLRKVFGSQETIDVHDIVREREEVARLIAEASEAFAELRDQAVALCG